MSFEKELGEAASSIPAAEAIERPKGPFDVNLRITVDSEIMLSRLIDQFFLGFIVAGVQASRVKDIARIDRVTKDTDGVEHFERITPFGPKQ